MISFIRLPYRAAHGASPRREIGPWATALILILILFFQLGLLLWVFLKDWRT